MSDDQTFSDGDLSDECFAFVPDGQPKSARKLKLCNAAGDLDPRIIGAAAAALGHDGYRGNRVTLPAGARAGVLAKVRRAWRKVNPSKSDAEMPPALRMSEGGAEDEPIAIYAIRGAAPAAQLHTYLPVAFAEPPEWSPFLPVPGTYTHPTYGQLDYTPDVYARMVANFKSGAYQDRLPVNAEHDPHAAGAIGWITDMRLGDTGAVEVKVEWNQRGKDLLDGDRYRYVSAEVMPRWTNPVNPDEVYDDVAVGMAVTTRPFFKNSVLPPLIASDAALTYAGDGMEDRMSETETTDTTETTPMTEQHTEPVPKPAAQRAAEQATLEMTEATVARFKEMEVQLAKQAQQLIKLTEENAAQGREMRTKEFTDEVKGRSDANRNPWVGNHDEQIAFLCGLADQVGKDSPMVRQYVQEHRAYAQLARTSRLFEEIGTGRGGQNTVEAKVDATAKTLMAANPSLTREKAIAQVYRDQPDLYEEQQRAAAGR